MTGASAVAGVWAEAHCVGKTHALQTAAKVMFGARAEVLADRAHCKALAWHHVVAAHHGPELVQQAVQQPMPPPGVMHQWGPGGAKWRLRGAK